MDESRQKALEALLGSLKDEPAFATLEDRAHDAGHLEEEDYAHLLDEGYDAKLRDNLRRHVLFCEVCSDELLRRAGRDLESAPPFTPTVTAPARRGLRVAVLFVVVATILVVGWLVVRGLSDDAPAAPPPREAFLFETVRVGTGARIGGAAAQHPTRLFLELAPPPTEPLWLYAYILSDDEFIPFHPDPDTQRGNPLESALFPPEGWVDIDVLSPRWFIGILTAGPVAVMEAETDRTTVSLELDTLRARGSDPAAIIAGLRTIRGLEDAAIFWVGIEE